MTACDPAVNVDGFISLRSVGHKQVTETSPGSGQETQTLTSQCESVKVFAESFFFFFNYSFKKKISHFQRCCVSPLS